MTDSGRVIMLVKDADATIVDMNTGEILGEYTIDPTKNYQPKKKTPPTTAEDAN